MTTRRTNKKLPLKAANKPELNLQAFFQALYKSEAYVHIKYILARLFYLAQTLVVGFIIQYVWNFVMVRWFHGDYQVNLFEAAILWICVY